MFRMNVRILRSWWCRPLVGVVLIIVVILVGRAWLWPRYLFTRYVLKPIPASVRDIKGQSPWTLGWNRVILRFRINGPDVPLILGTCPFEKTQYVKLDRTTGILCFGGMSSVSLKLYDVEDGAVIPAWLELDRLINPAVYRFQKDISPDGSHYRVFVFSEEQGLAYYIEDGRRPR